VRRFIPTSRRVYDLIRLKQSGCMIGGNGLRWRPSDDRVQGQSFRAECDPVRRPPVGDLSDQPINPAIGLFCDKPGDAEAIVALWCAAHRSGFVLRQRFAKMPHDENATAKSAETTPRADHCEPSITRSTAPIDRAWSIRLRIGRLRRTAQQSGGTSP
jgi:hypothetical protein